MKQFLKSLKKRHIVLASIYLFSILILVIARLSEGFCNVYAKYVFPLWVNTYGRLTSLLPFSFGEALIILGITILLLTLPSLAVLMIIKKKERKRVLRIYGFSYLCIIAFILLTETLNCFVIYRCSTFGDIYNIPATEHTNAELIELYDFLAAKCNERAGQMQRDDEGLFVLTADLDETAKEAMQNLGREFDRLDGFYVTPKPILNSYFMSQQYLMGMYFPFTLEANYNKEMYPSNLPETVCHELAHTRGFMLEDEANFIAYLACARSDNIEYQYSGYLRALKYVLSQIKDNCTQQEIDAAYGKLSNEVLTDINGNASYWRKVQESDEGILPSKKVAEVGDKAMEASLKFNGVEDGKKSYGRMVDLLLDYDVINHAEF